MRKLAIAALAAAALLVGAVQSWLRSDEPAPPASRTVEILPPAVSSGVEPEVAAEEPDPVPEPVARREPVPARPPEPELVEQRLAAPAPFVEAPLEADDEPGAANEFEEAEIATEPETEVAEAAPVDQDAWAARIRRMLAVYTTVGARR